MNIATIYRKTKIHFLKCISYSIGAMLGIFFGCDVGPGPVEYGMPHADYKVSGIVVSSDLHLPVKGLLVSIRDTMNAYGIIDSTKTDSLGRYSLQFTGVPLNSTWKVKVKDVDSTENGTFLTKDTVISIPESELQERSGNWYKGHAEKNIDLKVERKN